MTNVSVEVEVTEIDLTLPLIFNVPIPSPMARVFGREATSGPLACFINYRGTTLEREQIAQAAALCGVTASTFMRSVIMTVVNDILAHKTPT